MTEPDLLERLHDAAVLWRAGHGGPEAVVRAACDALAGGMDGYWLAMLAALPLRGLSRSDVEELLDQSLSEVGLPHYPRRSPEAGQAALIVMSRRALSGLIRPWELTFWAHRVYGDDRLPLAARLSELDDTYATIECTDQTGDVNAAVIAEARRIAAHVPRPWTRSLLG